MMECCSKDYDIRCVNSTSVLNNQHKWELEQKETDNAEAFKAD